MNIPLNKLPFPLVAIDGRLDALEQDIAMLKETRLALIDNMNALEERMAKLEQGLDDTDLITSKRCYALEGNWKAVDALLYLYRIETLQELAEACEAIQDKAGELIKERT